ncbi:hypothetical protein GCM10020219_073920 [Nonomuraea dietziae]
MLFAPSVTRRLIEAYTRRPTPAAAPPSPELGSLTAREAEVLKLVGHALSNTEIASRLCVSAATVKTHLNRAMTKLNLTSRAQAVALGLRSRPRHPRPIEPHALRLLADHGDVPGL